MALVTFIPTVFTTPGLPDLGLQGFSDSFDRASADTLGATEGVPSRRWEVIDQSTSTSTWGTTGNGTATMKTANFAGHFAVADARTGDGTFTAVLARYDDSVSGRFGLTVRFQDESNFVTLEWDSPTSVWPKLYEIADGTRTTLGTSEVGLGSTTEFSIMLDGSTVTVAQDGVTTITAEAPSNTANTKHGLYAFGGADAEWSAVSFAPMV